MSKQASVCQNGACGLDRSLLRAALAGPARNAPAEVSAAQSVLYFGKKECPVCLEARAVLDAVLSSREGADCRDYDLDSVEGLIEGSLRNALEVPTVLVLRKGRETARWEGRAPGEAEFRQALDREE